MANMYERICKLASDHGMTANQLIVKSGISPGTLGDLKSGKCTSIQQRTAQKIADTLGIYVGEVYADLPTEEPTIETKQNMMKDKQKTLFDLTRDASEEDMDKIINMVKAFRGEI